MLLRRDRPWSHQKAAMPTAATPADVAAEQRLPT